LDLSALQLRIITDNMPKGNCPLVLSAEVKYEASIDEANDLEGCFGKLAAAVFDSNNGFWSDWATYALSSNGTPERTAKSALSCNPYT